jgi:3-phenylpropionate/trans-cinnamate dioxygenase ferredoxin subunit
MLEEQEQSTRAQRGRPFRRRPVAQVAEIPPGERKIVEIDGQSIGIFNLNGEFRAVLNLCPHAFAPICRGHLRGTTLPSQPGELIWGRSGEILACPWHGWEFDLRTGQCLVDKRKLRLLPIKVEEGVIFV